MKSTSYAQPNEKIMASNTKNMNTFGLAKPSKPAKSFNAGAYAKAKKKAFGI